jgi:hypothetical protein
MATMTNQSKNKVVIVDKIQNKIIIATLIMQIIVSSLIGAFIYYNSKNMQINYAKAQTLLLLQPLQSSTQEMLQSIPNLEDKKNYLQIILQLQGPVMFPALKAKMPNLKEVYIYTDRKDIHTLENEPLWIFPKLKKALSYKDSSVTFTKDSFFVNVPIQIDNFSIGGIILEYSSDKINKEKQKALIISIILACSTFLLSLFLIRLFASKITKPLQEIVTDLEEASNSGSLTESTYNYSALRNSEFEPLISGYINMKQKISQQIYDLNEEIAKRKKAEKEIEISKTYLAETVDEKSEAIKEVSIMLKEEITKKTQAERKLRLKESTLDSLLKTNYCDGVLILSNTGEVLKINKKLSDDWELPEEVILNDSEEQLLKYFSYKFIDELLFRDKYTLCKNSNIEIGTFELKDGRKVLINYYPLKQDAIVIGKILTFYFT